MNLDHDFVQVSKLSEDQKKVFTKRGTLFSPNLGEGQKKRSSPEMQHFFPQFQVKTKKKRFSPKMEHFFPRIQ